MPTICEVRFAEHWLLFSVVSLSRVINAQQVEPRNTNRKITRHVSPPGN